MKRAAIGLISLLTLFAGCAAVRIENTGADIKEEPAKIIKAGTTMKEEIIKAFGEPSKTSTKDGTEELFYESKKVETPTYLGGLIIGEAGKAVSLKRLEVTIRDGIVQSYRFEAKEE